MITQKLGSCKFSSTLLPLLYFTFWSAILFNGISLSIAFTLRFVTKCTRFTLSPKLTIQLLIQIRKLHLSHESSTSRRGNSQTYYNNFTYEPFFSVTFGIVSVIILLCFFSVRTSPCYKEMFY